VEAIEQVLRGEAGLAGVPGLLFDHPGVIWGASSSWSSRNWSASVTSMSNSRRTAFGEIPRVVGDDDPGRAANGSCQHVPVIGVRQDELLLQPFPARYQRVLEGLVHFVEAIDELTGRDLRMHQTQGTHRPVNDSLRPEGPIEVALRNSQQGVR
jgi:hypothetical protein